jgi:hypothetical protein
MLVTTAQTWQHKAWINGPEGVRFYSGPFSNFSGGPFIIQTPVLELGFYSDDLRPERWSKVKSVEHYFQAMKATKLKD